MFTGMALRSTLKCASLVLGERGVLSRLSCSALSLPLSHGACLSSLNTRPQNTAELRGGNVTGGPGGVAVWPVRNYARAARKKKPVFQSQLSDLPPTMLKMEYADVPLAQTTDDLVKRLLSLELASHREKLCLKQQQLIAKVQREETDHSSTEVKIAILTARIRNYQEHLHKHPKDKANKRRMLMAIDRRKKMLKNLRMTRYDAFEHVCKELGITYSFPLPYYRRVTRRWITKKALCVKVFKEVQRLKAEQRKKETQASIPQASAGP